MRKSCGSRHQVRGDPPGVQPVTLTAPVSNADAWPGRLPRSALGSGRSTLRRGRPAHPRQAWHPGLRARPARQRAAGVCQPLSACLVAASRRARALREHSGRDGSPRRAAHPARPRSAQHPQSGRICMGDGDHPGVRGLALTRLRVRVGGQMRAGRSRRAAVRGPARRDRRQRSQPGAQSAGQRRIASLRRAAGLRARLKTRADHAPLMRTTWRCDTDRLIYG